MRSKVRATCKNNCQKGGSSPRRFLFFLDFVEFFFLTGESTPPFETDSSCLRRRVAWVSSMAPMMVVRKNGLFWMVSRFSSCRNNFKMMSKRIDLRLIIQFIRGEEHKRHLFVCGFSGLSVDTSINYSLQSIVLLVAMARDRLTRDSRLARDVKPTK